MIKIVAKQIVTTTLVAMCFAFFSCSTNNTASERANQLLSVAISVEDSNTVAALDIYEDVLDILLDNTDSILLRETYFRMGILMFRNALPDESIVLLNNAAHLDSALRDTTSLRKSLRSIALAYESIGQISKARETLHKIVHELPDDQSINYGNSHSDYYVRYNEMQAMKDEIEDAHIETIDRLTPKSTELEYIYKGWVAERSQDYDQALYNYSKLSRKYSYYVRAFGHLHTARIHMMLGNRDEAVKSFDLYEETNGLIRKAEKTSKQLLQHHASYQDRRAQKKIKRLTTENEQLLITIGVITTSAIIVVAFLLLIIRINRQRQIILKFRIDKIRQWREEYLAKGSPEKSQLSDAPLTGIEKTLKQKLNGSDAKSLTDYDWTLLEQHILALYPNFHDRLYDLCRLSSHDYHVCLLIKSGIKPSDIARLTIRSDEAISSTRRRLYQRAFGRKGAPSDWDEVIKML